MENRPMKDKNVFQEQMEQLKVQIEAIGKAVGELRTSGINEKVLLAIIQKAANKHHKISFRTQNRPISLKVIKAVLDGIEGLTEYVFPEVSEE